VQQGPVAGGVACQEQGQPVDLEGVRIDRGAPSSVQPGAGARQVQALQVGATTDGAQGVGVVLDHLRPGLAARHEDAVPLSPDAGHGRVGAQGAQHDRVAAVGDHDGACLDVRVLTHPEGAGFEQAGASPQPGLGGQGRHAVEHEADEAVPLGADPDRRAVVGGGMAEEGAHERSGVGLAMSKGCAKVNGT